MLAIILLAGLLSQSVYDGVYWDYWPLYIWRDHAQAKHKVGKKLDGIDNIKLDQLKVQKEMYNLPFTVDVQTDNCEAVIYKDIKDNFVIQVIDKQ